MPDRPIGHGGPRRVLASLAPLAIAALVALPGLGLAARVPRRAAAANPYTDIAKVSALARTAILTDLRLGIMGGTSRDTFDPSGLVARDVAVRLIVHALVASHALAAFPTAHSPLPYKDVAEGSPYDPTLALALKLGILPAAPTGSTFDPTANLTRVSLARWVLAASLQPAAEAPADPYRDLGHLAPAARDQILTATSLGLVPPAAKYAWDPNGDVTRAELAITLDRLYTLVTATLPTSLALSADTPAVAQGAQDPLTLSVLNAAGKTIPSSLLTAYKLTYAFVASGGGKAAAASVASGVFTASAAGTYGVAARLVGGDLAQPLTASLAEPLTVFGPASQVVVSGPTTLVADGLDAATLTLTVEDAGGRTVQTYNGAITVSASAPATVGVVGPGGSVATAPLTVVAADGVAQVSVRAGLTVGAQATIDARVGGDVNGSTTIATQAQVATAVSVQAASAAMAETKGTMDTVTGEVVDQAGFPMLTGTYPISFSLSQAAPDAVKLVNGGSNEGNGPVTLTFTGGSARPPTLALEATGAGAGSVAVDASTTATGVKAGSTTVHVVGSLPQGQAGTVDGLALAPEAGQGGVSVGGASLYSLSYTGTGTTPIPAPSALTVTLTAPSSGGGSAAFTDLPNGATSGAGGTTATVTIPQGTATISFGLSGESAGEVVLTAEASLPAEGDAPATTLGATLPVEVGAEAANPVGGVVLTVAGESSTTGNGTIGPGVAADVTAAGTEIPVTITLVGPTGQPVFAPEPEVVILSDQGLVAAPDGSEVPANTMSAGGSFAIDGSTASPVVVVPQGSSSLLVTYTNQDPGTYTLEAEVLDPVASGLATAAALSSQGTTATYSVNLVAVGLPQDEVLGNFAADIAVTSDLLQAPPTGEQVSTGGGGVYSVTVPWSNAPPAADSLYAEIEASGTSGPQAVTLGAPPTPALAESLTASTATLAIPASQGSAQLSYTVTASGKAAADVQVQVRLANAAGSDLSLSATGASTLANLTTNASGSATLTVYGSVVPDEATLSATLPSEPALNPVVTSVSVVSSGQDELLAPATELGATAFTADQGGEPLDFEVESPGGAPVAGATVDFTMAVGSNGLSLSRSSAKTNAQGVAVVRVRGYVTSAEGAVVASLPSAAGVSVSTGPITVEPGAPAEFATSLPAGDTITADTAHAGVRLLVILQDQYGNPIPGPDTLEIATSGPLSAANGQATTVTGSGGEALISLTDPTGAVGATTITVTDPSANGLHMTLPLTVTSGAPAAVTVQPLSTTQTQAGGTVPIELTATDAFGNPVSGTYPVTLGGTAVAPAPNGAPAPDTTVDVTFANGTPTQPILLNPVLAQSAATVTVSLDGLPPVAVPGTLDVLPGDAEYAVLEGLASAAGSTLTPTPTVGPWTGPVGERLPAPLPKTAYTATVQVTDAYGNPVDASGMAIDVAITPEAAGSASVSATQLSSGATGQATFTYTTSAAVAPTPTTGDVITFALEYTANETTVTTGGY